jgi:lipoprotein NlpD
MLQLRGRGWKWVAGLLAASALAGCSSRSRAPAPVEDRNPAVRAQPAAAPTPPAPTVEAPRPGPGADNAGKPGYYTVRPGDTLIRIALDSGQNWRDIARWNNIDNPNVIEVGQVLRVIPPAGTEVVARPVAPGAVAPAAGPPSSGASAPRVATAPTAPTLPPVNTPPVSAGEDDIAWAWPTGAAAVVGGFDEQRNKGLDIAGKPGDPVLAAADGRVVYAGAGLRGYGNLIILKHNNTFLSAYAHNQVLLVKEDQSVRKGQKIAEMGNTDADRVKLHFEIRRQGKPVDPARYLPPR